MLTNKPNEKRPGSPVQKDNVGKNQNKDSVTKLRENKENKQDKSDMKSEGGKN